MERQWRGHVKRGSFYLECFPEREEALRTHGSQGQALMMESWLSWSIWEAFKG